MTIKQTEKAEKVSDTAGPSVRPAPLFALGLPAMPTQLHFRRNHFETPSRRPAKFFVDGMRRLNVSLAELQARGAPLEVAAVLECAGHRRAELEPPVGGLQWELGAISEALWGGYPLRELLREAGVTDGAENVVLHGRDRGVRPSTDRTVAFARAISLEKAFAEDTLVAWQMNGKPIPPVHGGPIRAIVPGHYAVDSVKWLDRISLLDREFEGPFQRLDYRVFLADEGEGAELHELPVHALVISPMASARVASGQCEISGIAWGGADGVATVEVQIDSGAWRSAELERPSKWGRVFWRLDWDAPVGSHELLARATDQAGHVQSREPCWNTLGYANNSVHRIAFDVI